MLFPYKIMQAEVTRNRDNENVCQHWKGGTQDNKYNRPKLGSGQDCDSSRISTVPMATSEQNKAPRAAEGLEWHRPCM